MDKKYKKQKNYKFSGDQQVTMFAMTEIDHVGGAVNR